MPKLQALAALLFLISPALGEVILWTATGTLTNGTGVFLRQDLSPGDPIELRMTYDDQALPDTPTNVLGRIERDYRQNIDLTVTLTTENYTWEGQVSSAAGLPHTFFTRINNLTPTAESVEIQVTSTDLGTFPRFPFRLGETAAALSLRFQGANNSFLRSGITVEDFSLANLATATGSITTGIGNELRFTLDPHALQILRASDEIIPPIAPTVSATTNADNLILQWQSDFRFRYRIESTPSLANSTWTELETRFGTDALITRTYPRTTTTHFYRVVALDRPPLT